MAKGPKYAASGRPLYNATSKLPAADCACACSSDPPPVGDPCPICCDRTPAFYDVTLSGQTQGTCLLDDPHNGFVFGVIGIRVKTGTTNSTKRLSYTGSTAYDPQIHPLIYGCTWERSENEHPVELEVYIKPPFDENESNWYWTQTRPRGPARYILSKTLDRFGIVRWEYFVVLDYEYYLRESATWTRRSEGFVFLGNVESDERCSNPPTISNSQLECYNLFPISGGTASIVATSDTVAHGSGCSLDELTLWNTGEETGTDSPCDHDEHYQYIAGGSGNPQSKVFDDPIPAVLNTPPADSRWISYACDGAADFNPQPHQTVIHIPDGTNIGTLVLPLQYGAYGLSITVNNQSVYSDATKAGIDGDPFISINLDTTYLVEGDNTIVFSSSPDPTNTFNALLVKWGTPSGG